VKQDDSVVFVVDDDSSVREAIRNLIRSVGLRVEPFETAQQFLQSEIQDVPGCLVLDVRLPGLSGLDLQRELAARKVTLPIIFITGHGDIPMSVRAMKAGALEFLTKPFRDQDLLDAIQQALERARAMRQERADAARLRARLDGLTSREREVMNLVVAGLLNKQIAAELSISEITVKLHRSQVMKKMGANSLAELVRMAERLGVAAFRD
jgi:FixJ family two-component response regulator